MYNEQDLRIAWAAGLFDGEGSFVIYKEKYSKGLQIVSTDKDLLERLVVYFGGKIYKQSKGKKEHWKQVWVWRLGKKNCYEFAKSIYPYLCERRRRRADEFFNLWKVCEKRIDKRKVIVDGRVKEVNRLRSLGMKHIEIANQLGIDRTYVTKILNRSMPS